MNLETIYWLIPGYFCLLVYSGYAGIKHKGTWDFLIKLAPASAIVDIITKHLWQLLPFKASECITNYCPTITSSNEKEWIMGLGLVIAVLVGFVSPLFVDKFFVLIHWLREKALSRWLGVTNNPAFITDWHQTLLGKLVQVSTTTDKVYIGYFLGYSFEDHISGIVLAPFISGYRDDKKKVIFTTFYLDKDEDIRSMKKRELFLPQSQISGIAEFDMDLHKAMIRHGTSKLEISKSQTEERLKKGGTNQPTK